MTVALRDGAPVEVRPVEPDDRAALVEGFERLSPESRYRRFFGPMPRLSDRDLDYLTRVDHHDHEALVAVDALTGDGIGVARYVRTGPDVAEPAIVVADDWQGRGVGGLLLDALAERATEEGVRRFEAPVLATNHEAIALLERLGRTTRRPDGREVQLSIELPAGAPAGRWRSLLAQFAAGTVQPARTLLDALWPRRRGEPGPPGATSSSSGPTGPTTRPPRWRRPPSSRSARARRSRSSPRTASCRRTRPRSPRRSTPPRTPCASAGCTSASGWAAATPRSS